MEGFEHLVQVALESENFVVSGNMKFQVIRPIKKKSGIENATHWYEIDLVGARNDLLVLASVKSFFGSTGVMCDGFRGLTEIENPTARQLSHFNLYKLFNDEDVRNAIIARAAERFGYSASDIEIRLYVGKFQNNAAKLKITQHLTSIIAGSGPIRVVDLDETLRSLLRVFESKTYFNDPVIMTLKALAERVRQCRKTTLKKATVILSETLGLSAAQGEQSGLV
jgi:hypothetical protein